MQQGTHALRMREKRWKAGRAGGSELSTMFNKSITLTMRTKDLLPVRQKCLAKVIDMAA
jgi:hypothetical protein